MVCNDDKACAFEPGSVYDWMARLKKLSEVLAAAEIVLASRLEDLLGPATVPEDEAELPSAVCKVASELEKIYNLLYTIKQDLDRLNARLKID